jgi:hypothetical protein
MLGMKKSEENLSKDCKYPAQDSKRYIQNKSQKLYCLGKPSFGTDCTALPENIIRWRVIVKTLVRYWVP